MGLSVQFCYYGGNKNDIAKVYSSFYPAGGSLNCEPYDITDSMNPSIICNYVAGISGWNCAIISDGATTKYYFITSVKYDTGVKMIVNLHVDVLATYAGSIRNCPAVADRSFSGSKRNYYVPDPKMYHDSRQLIDNYDIGGQFNYNNGTLILMTAG